MPTWWILADWQTDPSVEIKSLRDRLVKRYMHSAHVYVSSLTDLLWAYYLTTLTLSFFISKMKVKALMALFQNEIDTYMESAYSSAWPQVSVP